MPLPPSGAAKKEEEIAQLCPVVSSAPKVNITENDGKNKEWAKRWNRPANIGAKREDASPSYGGHSLAKVIKSLRPVIFRPGRKKD